MVTSNLQQEWTQHLHGYINWKSLPSLKWHQKYLVCTFVKPFPSLNYLGQFYLFYLVRLNFIIHKVRICYCLKIFNPQRPGAVFQTSNSTVFSLFFYHFLSVSISCLWVKITRGFIWFFQIVYFLCLRIDNITEIKTKKMCYSCEL